MPRSSSGSRTLRVLGNDRRIIKAPRHRPGREHTPVLVPVDPARLKQADGRIAEIIRTERAWLRAMASK